MPTRVLTDRFVDALKPTARRQEYFDSHTRGLAIRVSESGRKVWVLLYRTQPNRERQLASRLRRLTLGQYPDLDLKKARKQAQIERGNIAEGGDPAADKQTARRASAKTGDAIADLAKEYIAKWAKPNKRSWRDDQRMLDAEVLPHWKNRKVKDLSRRDVRELIEAIAERGSPITANRCLALIRKMLNFAIEKDWIESNVASRIQKPGTERSRERVLTDDEIRLVWTAFESERPAMCGLLRLRLLTAQRGGELAQVRWADIEGDWLTIPGAITKNKLAHRVPLTQAAQDVLAAVPHIEGCDYVFAGRGVNKPLGDAKKGGSRTAERVLAKLQETNPAIETFDFRAHDLRRTASTRMAEAGIAQADIAKILNHTEGGPRATHVYNRYQYDKEKRVALETWGRVWLRSFEPNPATTRPSDVEPATNV